MGFIEMKLIDASMKLETIGNMKKNLELLDIKVKSLIAVHTLLTTTMFSAAGPYSCNINESILSMLEMEKKLKSDITENIRQLRNHLDDSSDKKSRRCWPSYLREIPGGKTFTGSDCID